MSLVNSKVYHVVELGVNFFLLNILWLLSCVPVVTCFPATIAMFGVIRDWHMKKDEGVLKPFFKHFVTNFKVSFMLTLIWFPIIVILYTNIMIVQSTNSIIGLFMTVLIGMLLLIFIYTTMYLFPVVVHFELNVLQLIRNAFFIASSQIKLTAIGLLLVFIASFLINQYPILMFFITSVLSYLIYAICHMAFQKIGAA